MTRNPAPETELRAEYKQQCPECQTILSRTARFCSGCGQQLREADD